MALINKRTGYYGFTLAGTSGGMPSDNQGRVNRCIFSIVYPTQVTDVDFTISRGADDWGAQMGDGIIVPLSNPVVLYQNRDNTIVQFDLITPYAANSPCLLVYRSDTATFSVSPSNIRHEFEVNSVTGHFAFTSDGYGGTTDNNGRVTRVVATIPFPQQVTDVVFTISEDPSHWGARMGDGSIINLRDPVVVTVNRDNALIQFTMDTPYASNSPCVLVYRSPNASIGIKVDESAKKFVPVTNVLGVPANIVTGVEVDLSSVEVEPFNATVQGIDWSIDSGNASVDGDTLLATSNGVIVLRATVPGGLNEGKEDYVKRFNVNVVKNTITITAQPPANVSLTFGESQFQIAVIAEAISNQLRYKWYHNIAASTSGATAVAGGITSAIELPANLELGNHYYYCVLSSPGASSVVTDFSKVVVSSELTGIEITPRPSTMAVGSKQKLTVRPAPATATLPEISWESSNINIAQIDKDGMLTIVGDGGTSKITAKTSDGRFSDNIVISVAAHIPVTNIENVVTTIDTNTATAIGGTVKPDNATNKGITWIIVDPGSTGATINAGVITATAPGSCKVRATITAGAGLHTDYIQDVIIKINKKFVPVTDIRLSLPAEVRADEGYNLVGSVVPADATYNLVTFNVTSPGTTGATITNGVLKATAAGTLGITATVLKGKSESENFTKVIPVTILPKWIPVEDVTGIPVSMEDVEAGIVLDAHVSPSNATMQQIVYKLTNGSKANAVLDGNRITVDYENVIWWNKNPNPTPPDYYDQWIEAITDPIILEITVPDGIKKGEDFKIVKRIGIVSPPSPSISIPLVDINLELPSILRARRPIVMSRTIKEPWNATNGEIFIDFARADTGQPGFALTFEPDTEPEEYWVNRYNLTMNPMYDWTMGGFYMYAFEDIQASVKYQVAKGNEDGTTYVKNDTLTFLPEYIPVRNITNIPSSLPSNAVIQLSPEFDTRMPITIASTEVYDLEIPSYDNVKWTVVNSGRTGAEITTDGVLSFNRTGTCIIQAEIPQGTQEKFTWYDKEFPAIPYRQQFEIQVTSAEDDFYSAIVTLKLKNGSTVRVTKMADFQNLCNSLPADATIRVGGQRIRKSDIVEVKFWDKSPAFSGTDQTVPITSIVPGKTKLGTNPIETWYDDPISKFDDVMPDDIADGTALVEDPRDKFNGMWKLPAFTFLKPDGSIVKYFKPRYRVTVEASPGSVMNYQIAPGYVFELMAEKKSPDDVFHGWVVVEGNVTITDPSELWTSFTMPDGDVHVVAWWNDEPEPVAAEPSPNTEEPVYETVLNRGKCVDAPFVISDISKIRNTSDMIKYDNGYIGIPEGSYIDTDGSILIDGTSSQPVWKTDIYGIVYQISENTESAFTLAWLPSDAILSNGCVIFDNRFSFDAETVTELTNTNFAGVRLHRVAAIETINKTISINDLPDVPLSSVTISTDWTSPYCKLPNNSVILEDGTMYALDESTGEYVLFDSEGHPVSEFMLLRPEDISVAPNNSTKKAKDVVWSMVAKQDTATNKYSKLLPIPNGSGTSHIFVPGNVVESTILVATVTDGAGWNGQDYVERIKVDVGNTSTLGKEITAINTNYATKLLFTNRWWSQTVDLSASLVGTGLEYGDEANITWSFSGNKSNKSGFSTGGGLWGSSVESTARGSSVTFKISTAEKAGTNIKVKAKVGSVEAIVTLSMVDEYKPEPEITSLHNFGYNFTSLQKIDRIPDIVTGDNCLKNFLRGCVSFNQQITIPEHVTGDSCLEGFLTGCTSFNQRVVIPENVAGRRCLNRFLSGCSAFNQIIAIPEGITGPFCLTRFLEGCKSFNQPIVIPTGVAGERCLEYFLSGCEIFNQPITIPDGISGDSNMRGFMINTMDMTSLITISEQAATNCQVNGLTLACFKRDVAYDVGVPVGGSGASIFMGKAPNATMTIPLRRLILQTPEVVDPVEPTV